MLDKTQGGRKVRAAIVGSGNIGTDLMYKLRKNPNFEVVLLSGIDPASEGLARAREMGVGTSTDGAEAVFEDGQCAPLRRSWNFRHRLDPRESGCSSRSNCQSGAARHCAECQSA
jgi:hypothetical protein